MPSKKLCGNLEISVPLEPGYEVVEISAEYQEIGGLGGYTRNFNPQVNKKIQLQSAYCIFRASDPEAFWYFNSQSAS